jgi:predicted alpha/beta hydrolase
MRALTFSRSPATPPYPAIDTVRSLSHSNTLSLFGHQPDMNGTDIFGLLTGGLGVLGFLWSLAQWLSPYTRFSALQRTVQRLECLVEEVEDRGVRLDVGVMREIWARYHRCDLYYLFPYEIHLTIYFSEFTKSTTICVYRPSSSPPSCTPRSL